jgi:hypothetical protein
MTKELWLCVATMIAVTLPFQARAQEGDDLSPDGSGSSEEELDFSLEGSGETWDEDQEQRRRQRRQGRNAEQEEQDTWLTVRHEVGATLGPAVALDGLHEAGDAAFIFDVSYFFRIVPAWHVGAFLHFDQFGKASGDVRRQRQVGFSLAARWGWALLENKLEIGVAGFIGYEYLDLYWDHDGHWLVFGIRPRVAWIIFRGLGVAGHIGPRIGYVAGLGDTNHFGAMLDFGVSVFWAW